MNPTKANLDMDEIYMECEANGEGEPRAMVRYAYEAGHKAASMTQAEHLPIVVTRLRALADYFSPPSGDGTDHAIQCNCNRCEWADDLREAANLMEGK